MVAMFATIPVQNPREVEDDDLKGALKKSEMTAPDLDFNIVAHTQTTTRRWTWLSNTSYQTRSASSIVERSKQLGPLGLCF